MAKENDKKIRSLSLVHTKILSAAALAAKTNPARPVPAGSDWATFCPIGTLFAMPSQFKTALYWDDSRNTAPLLWA